MTIKTKWALLMLLLVVSFNSWAQVAIITGIVVDDESGDPVTFAHISLANTTIGTISNAEGHFSLKTESRDHYDLVFSSIGYEKKEITKTINSIKNLVVQLKPDIVQLTEITILTEPESAKELLTKAYEAIPENYNIGEHSVIGYHKESEYTDDEPIYIVEEVIAAEIPAKGTENEIRISRLKGRKRDLKEVKQYKITYKVGFVYGRLRSSILRPRRSMLPKEMKKFTYAIEEYSTYNDRPVAIISFTDSKRKPYYGSFTIDLETFAFVRIERNNVHGAGMPTDDWKWTHHRRVEYYVQDNSGSWRLNSSIYHGDWIKKKSGKKFTFKDFYVTTDYSEESVFESTMKDETSYEEDLYENMSTDFDEAFWEEFNAVKLSNAELEAVNSKKQ